MNILGLTKTTLLDYPDRVAATIFIGGCNFRCPFCHNSGIVFQDENLERISKDYVIRFLIKRKNVLTGVCITGGEPTLNPDLPDFIRKIKEIGYKVKLDTNGTNPQMLKILIEENLIDYCAMDIKNSREKYALTCGVKEQAMDKIIINIEESISILMNQNQIDYEFRTTIVKELHTKADIKKIANTIKAAPSYYLQSYKESTGVISKGYTPPATSELTQYLDICKETIPNAKLRGI